MAIKTPSTWLAARVIGLLCVAVSAPWFYDQMQKEFEKEMLSWFFVIVMLLATSGSVIFVMSLQRINPIAAKSWLKPSWRASFADVNQPLQSLHFGGWVLLTLGAAIGLYTLANGSSNLLFVLPLIIGIGVLVGVKLVVWVFRKKFSD